MWFKGNPFNKLCSFFSLQIQTLFFKLQSREYFSLFIHRFCDAQANAKTRFFFRMILHLNAIFDIGLNVVSL